jgi:hypothetical protein
MGRIPWRGTMADDMKPSEPEQDEFPSERHFQATNASARHSRDVDLDSTGLSRIPPHTFAMVAAGVVGLLLIGRALIWVLFRN